MPPPISTRATPSLIWREHGLGAGELLDHGVDDLHTGAVDAATMFCVDDTAPVTTCTLTSSRAPVIPCGADAVLFVHDEVLRKHVQDLAASRKRNRLRCIDRSPHIVSRVTSRFFPATATTPRLLNP